MFALCMRLYQFRGCMEWIYIYACIPATYALSLSYQKYSQRSSNKDKEGVKMRYDQQSVWSLAAQGQPAASERGENSIIEDVSDSPHSLALLNNTETTT